MGIEAHIKKCVLEQCHLADILIGHENSAAEIRARVVALLETGVVKLYTYNSEPDRIVTLAQPIAVAAAIDPANWVWRSHSGSGENYFLAPVKLADGRLAYGLDYRD